MQKGSEAEMAEFDGPRTGSAEDESEGHAGARKGRGAFGKAINLLGAVASLALIAGVGLWGYRLVVRDVSGVPVVRAAQGPIRMQPEDPGGQPADHQGLAVNAVAAEGSAAPTADQLLLAPSPVDLAEEDAPMPELAAAPPEPAASAEPPAASETEPEADPEAVATFEAGAVDDLIRQLLTGEDVPEQTGAEAGAESLDDLEETTQAATLETGDLPQAEPAVLTGPGPHYSPRPKLRPAEGARVVVAAAAPTAQGPLDVDPDSLPAGTKLAQLGAYDSAELARADWDRLNGQFADYLADKRRVIQKASTGGKEFYRLRAMGFDDLSDARRFCSAFVAEGADCIPVVVR